MKHLGIASFLLSTIFSVAAPGQEKPTVQPTRPVVPKQPKPKDLDLGSIFGTSSKPASPSQTRSSDPAQQAIKQIIRDLPKELATGEQRARFAATVNLLIAKRIAAEARGYEQTFDFQMQAAEINVQFLKMLQSGTTAATEEQIDEFAKISGSAFANHRETFMSFYENVIRSDPQFKALPITEVMKTMLQVSALFYINRLWPGPFTVTYVWPWCQTPSPVIKR